MKAKVINPNKQVFCVGGVIHVASLVSDKRFLELTGKTKADFFAQKIEVPKEEVQPKETLKAKRPKK